jgi:hypothetical protein
MAPIPGPRTFQVACSGYLANDPLLRGYLYEAAAVLMSRVKWSCPLREWVFGSPNGSAGSAHPLP